MVNPETGDPNRRWFILGNHPLIAHYSPIILTWKSHSGRWILRIALVVRPFFLSTCESTWGLGLGAKNCDVRRRDAPSCSKAGLIQLKFAHLGSAQFFRFLSLCQAPISVISSHCNAVQVVPFFKHGSRHGLKHRPSCTNFRWIIPWDPEFQGPTQSYYFCWLITGSNIYSIFQ